MTRLLLIAAPRNDASRALLHGSDVVTSKPATAQLNALIILTLALFASATPSLCQAQPAGGPVIDRIEARVEQLRESLDKHSAESKAWRDRWDYFDRHPDGGRLFDGHRVAAAFAWLAKGLQTVWLILVGAYRITWGLIAAVIAVCVARTVREVSEAVRVWRPKA